MEKAMNATYKLRIKTLALLTLGALVLSPCEVWAERDEDGKRPGRKRGASEVEKGQPGHEERVAFRKAQHEKGRTFYKAQREKVEAAREAARAEEDPYAVVAALKAGHEKNLAEMTAFSDESHAEALAFFESMVSKYEIPEDKQTQIKASIEERYSNHKARQDERHGKVSSLLATLAAKDGLTKKDIKEAMKSLRKGGQQKSGGRRGGKRGEGKGRGRHKGEKENPDADG
jgi:hypothetical protein